MLVAVMSGLVDHESDFSIRYVHRARVLLLLPALLNLFTFSLFKPSHYPLFAGRQDEATPRQQRLLSTRASNVLLYMTGEEMRRLSVGFELCLSLWLYLTEFKCVSVCDLSEKVS